MSIIKHVTLQTIVDHDFRYGPRVHVYLYVYILNMPRHNFPALQCVINNHSSFQRYNLEQMRLVLTTLNKQSPLVPSKQVKKLCFFMSNSKFGPDLRPLLIGQQCVLNCITEEKIRVKYRVIQKERKTFKNLLLSNWFHLVVEMRTTFKR